MMHRFIIENIVYPKTESKAGITGTCYVSFVVEKDGAISDITLLKGIQNAPGYNAETLRLVALMPKWKPAMLFGNLVRVQFNLPIRFTIRDR